METSTWHLASLPSVSRRRGVRVAGVVVLALILAVGLVLGSRSSVFRVRELSVSGATHLSRAEIVRLSGITRSTNVLWMNAEAVVRRLETNPWIADASVSGSLSGSVEIQVVEKAPIAVRAEGGAFRLIAEDGTSLGSADRAAGLPLIVTPPASEAPAPDLAGTARALETMDPEVRSQVRRVLVGVDGTIELWIAGGLRIRYGTPTDLAAKAESLRRVLGWARETGVGVRVVDLTAPAMPAAVLEG